MTNDGNRVKEIFLEAVEQPDEAARSAYLDRVCGDDAGLRERVEALLRSHDPAGSFLGSPAVKPPEADGATQELGVDQGANPDDDANGADDLPFLSSSTRPDSLGRLGHYEMLQVLGKGGFGIVFRAFDETLQRVVAVKVMAPQIATLSPARKRFLREARSSAQVRHENVVQVYEVGERPLPYLAMEFIPGETLQQKLDRSGPLDVPEVLRVGRQVAEGLAAAHACDLIHRDIKPANVLIEGGPQKRAKITDFGLARAADDASISQSGVIAGTPMYMAPEQALGHKLDQRADLFSLGSVLYQMVAGRPPFRAPSTLAVLKRVAEESPRPIAEIIPETPAWLCEIIAKLHAKNPDDRYQSAREVADVLADCEAQLKVHAKIKDFSRIPRGKPRRSGRWKWVAAAAVLLLPVIALAVTECAGVTHLFRQQATTDPDRKAAEYVLSIGGQVQVDGRDRNINAAAELPRDPFRLTWVGLKDSNQVSETGLANFKDCQNLTFLGLFDTSVGDKGLANFQNCTKLTFLNLSRTKISDAGLANFRNCTELTTVVLSETKVSDAGLSYLKSSKNLRNLLLQKTNVTAAGIDDLKNAAPLCKIDWDGGVSGPPPVAKLEAPEPGSWVQLFNGKDLTGWKSDPKQPVKWRVENGLLTSEGPPGYLFSERADFEDFHVRLEVLIPDDKCYSGLHFRTPFGSTWKDGLGQPGLTGYDAPLASFGAPPGSLVVVAEKVTTALAPEQHVEPGEWFTLEVIARGNHLTTKINGKFAASLTDDARSFTKGHLALQQLTADTKVQFRKIEIKELPPLPVVKPEPPPTFTNGIGMEFVIVPKGKSWLGGGKDKLGDREVIIPADFYLGKYEVAQEEWEKVMGENPSSFSRTGGGKDAVKDVPDADLKRFPVESVSWDDCQLFVEKLNQREKEAGWVYRLPKMTEWEYACRGGPMADRRDSAFDFYFANPANTLSPGQANFGADKGLNRACKVGSYQPNRLGLFDLHGNVQEWCEDSEQAAADYPKRLRGGSFRIGQCEAKGVAGSKSTFRGDDLGLRLARVPADAASPEAKTPPPAAAPFTDADVQRIAALPAEQQIEEVRKELMRRNPKFDGTLTPTIENDVVTGLQFHTDEVDNIAPARALKGLTSLDCSGASPGSGKLADLSPLHGAALTSLTVKFNPVLSDLTPLKGMPLTFLDLYVCQRVSDLTPVQGMPLTSLGLGGTKVGNLTPLKGMPLDYLNLWGLTELVSLEPLNGLPLTHLYLGGCNQVRDLSPLKGMPLKRLFISSTGVADLSPLKDMPLEGIRLTPRNITKGLEILRDMKSLKTVSAGDATQAWSAAEFWERYDKGEFKE